MGLQRGDAEMAQKLWRVVRACVELGGKNPIKQIHDQGAGGNCNVVSNVVQALPFHPLLASSSSVDVRCFSRGSRYMEGATRLFFHPALSFLHHPPPPCQMVSYLFAHILPWAGANCFTPHADFCLRGCAGAGQRDHLPLRGQDRCEENHLGG
jgi:AIR synthase related protein, C-terminal domain